MEYNNRNDAIRWQIQPLEVIGRIFTLALIVLEITFEMFNLENFGQGCYKLICLQG